MLYPENWIESNLRDDKSPFFNELESELLQKDINKQNVTDALKNYLYKVDEVANMEVVGLYIEESTETTIERHNDGKKKKKRKKPIVKRTPIKLHVFSRTRNAPYFFYYRYLDLQEMNWYPWEKMQVDIPSYDVEDGDGKITGNGCYLTPVVWNGRLLIFFPQFMKKVKAADNANIINTKPPNGNITVAKPIEYWEIKMAWSEYRNGKWTQKQISNNSEKQSRQVSSTIAPLLIQERTNAEEAVKAAIEKAGPLKIAWETAKRHFKEAQNDSRKNNETIMDSLSSAVGDTWELYEPAKKELDIAKQNLANAKKKIDEDSGNNTIEVVGEISLFEFAPLFSDDSNSLAIKIYYNNQGDAIGIFEFDGNTLQVPLKKYSGNNSIISDYFHYTGLPIGSSSIQSLQANSTAECVFERSNGIVNYNGNRFYHPFIKNLLNIINSTHRENFFKFNLAIGGIQDEDITQTDIDDTFGNYIDSNGSKIYHELKRPYSLYNWELFFHTPIMIADALSKAQQFEEAMKWFHYVFNPIVEGTRMITVSGSLHHSKK